MQFKKPIICIIGCGRTGLLLTKRLIHSWHLLVIDKDTQIIKNLKKEYKNKEITVAEGDATSYHVLKKILIKNIYQVLVSVGNDAVTNEIVHLLLDRFRINNIVVQVMDNMLANNLRKKGIGVVYPPETAINFIINQMKLGEATAVYVGKGEGEILQIQLTNSSPLIEKPLKELPPRRRWIIGGIYRPQKRPINYKSNLSYLAQLKILKNDKLIIPSGNTKPKAGDKLLLIGDPHILRSTAQYLKAGFPVFPTRHGNVVVSLLLVNEKDILSDIEYKWLLEEMEPSEMVFLYRNKSIRKLIEEIKFSSKWEKANKDQKTLFHANFKRIFSLLNKIVMQKRIGLVIYKQPMNIFLKAFHNIFLIPLLLKRLRRYDTPLWIIKKHKKITGITLFVSDDEGTLRAAELTVDVALKLNLSMKAIRVNPPLLIAGKNQIKKSMEIMQSVRELCALYGVNIQEVVKEGNPVKEVISYVKSDELLVTSFSKESNSGFLIPNSAKIIRKKFSGSMLILAT